MADKPKMRQIATMTNRDIHRVQNHLTLMRQAVIKAHIDISQILIVEEGETQTALEGEVFGFMRDAQAHFAALKEILIDKS